MPTEATTVKIQISLVGKDGIVLCHETVDAIEDHTLGVCVVKFCADVARAEVNLSNEGIIPAAVQYYTSPEETLDTWHKNNQ